MKWICRLTLVHFCTMLIVLPVGGWCWLPLMLLTSKTSSAPKPRCEHCCSKEKSTPAPKEPAQFPRCCSKPQQAYTRTTVTEPEQDVAVVPTLAMDMPLAPRTGLTDSLIVREHGPAPPLRVLHCVWLC